VNRLCICTLACLLAGCAAHTSKPQEADAKAIQVPAEQTMQLGNFSVSLNVKDIAASRAFYEKLGFRARMGQPAKNWIILQNGTATIGLFQGMFDKNTLTFNPGWDRDAKPLPKFEDVRDLQKQIKEKGLIPAVAADESSTGPAYFMLIDPDGNPILVDQHIPRPAQ
jgi:catechol 2,3-dioxygenase-like lactoylglutathione lyase family enzyme